MTEREKRLYNIGIHIPKICMPNKTVDMTKWSVVACDQYTSEKEYWKEISEEIGDNPSTLNLIFPESYLEDPGPDERISRIHNYMRTYLDNGYLEELSPGVILVRRDTKTSPTRYGLVIALDLEKYDYNKGSRSLIRATEGTIVNRIPPRMKIRSGAPLEFPHILVLIDDPDRSVIGPVAAIRDKLDLLYDFDLMKGGGHISGYMIKSSELIEQIIASLEKLADPDVFFDKYGKKDVLLYAMGDGNHSLATAKATWEELKQKTSDDDDIMHHPARWALVEIENIYDEGLIFEPIHRVIFNVDPDLFFKTVSTESSFTFEKSNSVESILKIIKEQNGPHKIGYADSERLGIITIENPASTIPAGTIQNIIDTYVKMHPESSVDYIHGADVTEKLGKKSGNCGIFLPAVDKSDFFQTVIMDGALPRKTFSMGEAHEKRFYIESRKII